MKQESEYIKVLRKLKQLQAQFNEAKQTIAIQLKSKAGQVKTVESVKSAKSDQKCKRMYNFCGKQGHFVQDCRTVSKYTQKGKCMRLGKKIVLMSRSFVLADVEGVMLIECID